MAAKVTGHGDVLPSCEGKLHGRYECFSYMWRLLEIEVKVLDGASVSPWRRKEPIVQKRG